MQRCDSAAAINAAGDCRPPTQWQPACAWQANCALRLRGHGLPRAPAAGKRVAPRHCCLQAQGSAMAVAQLRTSSSAGWRSR